MKIGMNGVLCKRSPGVVHGVEGGLEVLAHDDGALDGQLEVCQRLPHQGQDLLHPANLLSERFRK